jgi:hypothetical protein
MKLDWCLSKGLDVVDAAMGNDEFTMSDHKYLLVKYRLPAAPVES